MTVSYTASVASTTCLAFLKLLFRWKGSVYKVIWFEFVTFSILYAIISLTYRFAFDEPTKRAFECFCLHCEKLCEIFPVGFVLGFYVNTIVRRWWEQFCAIPWPDSLVLFINAYAHSTSERARMQRRTFIRYVNLSFCLTTRNISSRARLRFPTLENLITAGLVTPEELRRYRQSASDGMEPINFLPLCWAQELVTEMYQEKNIVFDRAIELLTAEIGAYRDRLYQLCIYDWINVPLVYTQVATLIVYSYFIVALFAWQYLDPNQKYKHISVDLYVPTFGLLRFLFYMGWLKASGKKVAETLISPFGEDEDDFEIEEYIERNVQFTNFWDRAYNGEIPPVVPDAYWDAEDINLPDRISMTESGGARQHSVSSISEDPLRGSLAKVNFTDCRKMSVFVR
eukprot:TsM_000287500 transcript=TsM_000287500 gene=TsM_000287500